MVPPFVLGGNFESFFGDKTEILKIFNWEQLVLFSSIFKYMAILLFILLPIVIYIKTPFFRLSRFTSKNKIERDSTNAINKIKSIDAVNEYKDFKASEEFYKNSFTNDIDIKSKIYFLLSDFQVALFLITAFIYKTTGDIKYFGGGALIVNLSLLVLNIVLSIIIYFLGPNKKNKTIDL